jgi:hypothetical protein
VIFPAKLKTPGEPGLLMKKTRYTEWQIAFALRPAKLTLVP